MVALTSITLLLGVLALVSPLAESEAPAPREGFLLAIAAALEVLHGIRRSSVSARRQAATGAFISIAIALLLINAPLVASAAVLVGMAGFFLVDAVRYAIAFLRSPESSSRRLAALAVAGNLGVALLLVAGREWAITWTMAIAVALRIFGTAWNIAVSPVHTAADAEESVVAELAIPDSPRAAALIAEVEAGERARAPVDRGWILAFVATLFAIHIGRMGTDGTLLGILAPAVAVAGDMLIAVLFTMLLINPLYLLWRWPTRWIERPMWRWYLSQDDAASPRVVERIASAWLRRRLRFAVMMRAGRYSILAAINQALQYGLPLAAVIAATVPIWGMSWYFDTENWAAAMWNSWAESRTATWREAMVHAVLAEDSVRSDPLPFAVRPGGVDGPGDFSFIVIGDTGEGDASQHILRDQLLAVANHPDVRFVVVSSDVVYPVGAMRDYEAKFWLPFKGVIKPVYAIPGNHDWYDALEAFAATFLEPAAARTSMRARVETDLRLTSTTDDRIEKLIRQADWLRQQYEVPTGFQRAPFFEIQSNDFALLSVDTGVIKRVDPAEWSWLQSALARSRGKLIMAVLGHPFYAGGSAQTAGYQDFAALRALLQEHGVAIIMAGDTHDLEYYLEPQPSGPAVHHFVNGGGGAYLSFGTSLAWPRQPPTAGWAFYPETQAVMAKIQAETPWWKRPAWWWTRQLGAWPFSAEWLSAVFDYNVAPFFQSFVEVRVERSTRQIRLRPYGIHGRLTWGDFASSESIRPPGATRATAVEWSVPMAR
jgi:3',5'-cyclic AMP phosphodiesterase CpdA